ncbi:MAG: aminotransferase class IV [Flavobacterium sp.]|nr:aminotransferase class IV [Flavobacterium sp.]
MINYNGDLVDSQTLISNSNRSFLYGDGIFETIKVVNNKILFFEDHYFRLMASMRIVRMQIPPNFTLEFLESQILELVKANAIENAARIRFTVFRNDGGFYLPATRQISYLIQSFALDNKLYKYAFDKYEVDLFKDFFIAKQLLSTLKTTNKMINITGSIFADENGFQNCLLLNNEKNVVEALNGNVFMLIENQLVTPPTADGCLNGIMRKQVLRLSKSNADITFLEQSISPFDLQKADELFITNVITGIQPISKYRKKEFKSDFAVKLIQQINANFLI